MQSTVEETKPERQRASLLWPRAAVLLLMLVAIKVGVIGSLTDQLFTTHWRWMSKSVGWFEHFNFWLFTGLLAGSLVALGLQARGARPREVRALNASLVVIGLIFALLIRQQFERNYLYTYMLGLLDFAALAGENLAHRVAREDLVDDALHGRLHHLGADVHRQCAGQAGNACRVSA